MAIKRTQVTASPSAGGAGTSTATANTSVPIEGEILAIHLAYLDSPPAGTTDVTIAEAGPTPQQTILTVANAATDGWFYPMAQAKNTAATDISGMGRPLKTACNLSVTIAQANDGDGVTATIMWDDKR